MKLNVKERRLIENVASRSELEAIIRLAGNVDPSLQRALLDAQRRMDDLGDTSTGAGERMKNAFVFAAKGAAAGAAAVVAFGAKGVSAAEDYRKAMNGLQTQAGITTEQMKGFEDIAKNIYNNNFGDSFEDIAKSMSMVKTTTGLSGIELEKLTTNALLLRDTFEMDVAESVRSADKLMRQFGISGDQAMSLFAEGTQKGLDYAQDLLPTIDEYSVYFKQAGFSATEMFGLFENAKNAGIFNLDYAADAIKEFGIIMTEEGDDANVTLKKLGLNGAALREQFAKGGDGAKDAFKTIAKALEGVDDKQAQVALGVQLFGTKFEDVGAQGIIAMTQVNDSIQGTSKTLDSINAIKYDTFGETLAGIGRNFNTSILIPLGEKVLPKLNELADWVTSKMPVIKKGIENAFEAGKDLMNDFGDAMDWVKRNSDWLVPAIAAVTAAVVAQMAINGVTGLITAYKTWRATTAGVTLAQAALNAVMAMSPFGWVALAIGAVVGAGILLWQNWDTVKAKASELWAWISGVWTSLREGTINVFNGVKDSVAGTFNSMVGAVKVPINSIIGMINGLIGKLNGISIDFPDWMPGDIGGKSFGLSIPTIPTFAKGGFTNQPSIFGEAGPEAAIPLKRTPRSLSLLNQTASKLGVDGGSGGSPQFIFAPVIGGGDAAGIMQTIKTAGDEFFEQADRWWESKRRESFG